MSEQPVTLPEREPRGASFQPSAGHRSSPPSRSESVKARMVRELEWLVGQYREALEEADAALCRIPVAADDLETEAVRSDAINLIRATLAEKGKGNAMSGKWIGRIRRSLFVPRLSRWNAWVRDFTARFG